HHPDHYAPSLHDALPISGTVAGTGTRAVTTGQPRPEWLAHCRDLNDKAGQVVREELAGHPKPTGLHVAAVVMDALREGDQLLLGASNPVRDAALVSAPR